MVCEKIKTQLVSLTEQQRAQQMDLPNAIACNDQWMDSTCIKANIHFPVDWVLLRDAARSVLLAIKTIRQQGLKHRIAAPEVLLKNMNRLCIRLLHTRRQKESKKQRKMILREMKKLVHCIGKHAKRYHDLLERDWQKTTWTKAQTQVVLERLTNILEQLPQAIWQAHERIIGERTVAKSKKLLSLYDKAVHIILRGKSGSEVEFGQGFVFSEQRDGLITD